MKKQFIIFTLLTFNLPSFAQSDLGVKINGGLSKISQSFDAPHLTYNTQFALSGQTGLFYIAYISDKSILGAELLFLQIEGNEKIDQVLIDSNGDNIGFFKNQNYWHISYLGIPVYYGYKFYKITVNVGFQASYNLFNSVRAKSSGTIQKELYNSDRKHYGLDIYKFDFGPRAGFIYDMTDKLAIEGNYYYGIVDYTISTNSWKWNIQQMTIGLRYKFLNVSE